jgi:hypothetical protein
MRRLLGNLSAICLLAAVASALAPGIVPAVADDVPSLNVEPVCRGIAQQAAAPSEKGGPDLAYSQCVSSEQAMREHLSKEWTTFTAADKSGCVGEARSTSLPSYTDLVTCLEMARDARKLHGPSGQ